MICISKVRAWQHSVSEGSIFPKGKRQPRTSYLLLGIIKCSQGLPQRFSRQISAPLAFSQDSYTSLRFTTCYIIISVLNNTIHGLHLLSSHSTGGNFYLFPPRQTKIMMRNIGRRRYTLSCKFTTMAANVTSVRAMHYRAITNNLVQYLIICILHKLNYINFALYIKVTQKGIRLIKSIKQKKSIEFKIYKQNKRNKSRPSSLSHIFGMS